MKKHRKEEEIGGAQIGKTRSANETKRRETKEGESERWKDLRDQSNCKVIFGDIGHIYNNERRPECEDGINNRSVPVTARVVEEDGGAYQPQGYE